MIVKNENHVIRRCLASVLPFITHWAIIDTGSTDGTQDSIRSYMEEQGIPGELVERPWINFAHNRSESLTLGTPHGEYLLVIDADEYLEPEPGFTIPPLTADVYHFDLISGPHAYPKRQLLRSDAGWRYLGVVHEDVVLPRTFTEERLPGIRTIRIMDGARSRDPLTYRRDALVLEEALLSEPGNSRYMFYLAQSYADAREPDLAIDRYGKRMAMGGWEEEVWCSKYQTARLLEVKGEPWPTVQQAFLDAFALRPLRAEPLFRIGAHYQIQREFGLAHLFFSRAIAIPYPSDEVLLVEHEVYRFLLPLEYAVACFYVGQHEDAIRISNRMLAEPTLTPEQRDQVIRNRQYSLDALYPPLEVHQRTETLGDSAQFGDPGDPGVVVVVLCGEADRELEACIQSLRCQNRSFRTVLIQRGESKHSMLNEALRDPTLTIRQVASHAGWAECLHIAAGEANPGEIVLLLPADTVLADKRCIADLAHSFRRYDCALLYGQFRWADDGSLGNAMPLASPGDLKAEDAANSRYTLAFRKELLDGAPLSADAQPLHLMRCAGHDHIRFSDRPLTLQPR